MLCELTIGMMWFSIRICLSKNFLAGASPTPTCLRKLATSNSTVSHVNKGLVKYRPLRGEVPAPPEKYRPPRASAADVSGDTELWLGLLWFLGLRFSLICGTLYQSILVIPMEILLISIEILVIVIEIWLILRQSLEKLSDNPSNSYRIPTYFSRNPNKGLMEWLIELWLPRGPAAGHDTTLQLNNHEKSKKFIWIHI